MAEVTLIKLIFPLGFDCRNMIKTYWSDRDDCFVGAVFHRNLYWTEEGGANYASDMEVHIGVEREAEPDIFGKLTPVPATGILCGEFVRFDPWLKMGDTATGGWGWLVFRLRYDMQREAENWDLHKSGYQVYTTGQNEKFYYAAEKSDEY